MVSKIQGQIVALLCGFFLARPREDKSQSSRISIFGLSPLRSFWNEAPVAVCVCSARPVEFLKTMLSKHPRIFSRRKLRAFQDEHQVACRPVPRTWLESLAENEHGRARLHHPTRRNWRCLIS